MVVKANELGLGEMFEVRILGESFDRTFIVTAKTSDGMVEGSTWLGKDLNDENINITAKALVGKDCYVRKTK